MAAFLRFALRGADSAMILAMRWCFGWYVFVGYVFDDRRGQAVREDCVHLF
jgi:hypothetical protein